MRTTTTFAKNLGAYEAGNRLIVNQGGSSSSKTYSILQLLYIIAKYSARKLTIHVVSRSLPHLKLGAMHDFENILVSEGYIIDDVKQKTENYFKIGKSIITFFGVEDAKKVHGPRRDILYINECNHVSFEVYRQLAIRTNHNIFLDYNPTRAFWVHEELIGGENPRPHFYIQSTYKDNEELSQETIDELELNKHNENWWNVYGLGNTGRLEGAIFNNWSIGPFNYDLPSIFGLDFGTKHPDAMVRVAVDRAKRNLYWKEELYKSNNNIEQLSQLIKNADKGLNKLIIADSAALRDITNLRDMYLHNIRAVKKNKIVEDIKLIWGYNIIVEENSKNLEKELATWEWLDKKGELPMDVGDDAIDAARYATQTLLKAGPAMSSNARYGRKSSRIATR